MCSVKARAVGFATNPMCLPRCLSRRTPARLPRSRDNYDAEDIEKAQIAIHCFTSDRPARCRWAAALSSRCNLPRSAIAPWLSLSSGAVSASIPGTEACSAKWSRQQHSAVLG